MLYTELAHIDSFYNKYNYDGKIAVSDIYISKNILISNYGIINKIISDLYKNKIVLYNNNDEKILLTLTLDNVIFSSNSNIVKCSSNGKQVTIEGSEL